MQNQTAAGKFMISPKVSILIPVYNGGHFLAECLDSVLAQDFPDMEILMADDGSTDGSSGLMERYAAKDRRIRWWKNPRNLGLAANFNCCLAAARGEYVKFVLQDDKLVSPAAVRLMAGALDADAEVALVASASQLLDGESRVTEIRDEFKPGTMAGVKTVRDCFKQSVVNHIGEPTVVMFRRALAGRGFNPRYKQLVDLEMWIHLLAERRFAYLSEPLCAFRQHAAQQTKVNRRQIPTGTEEVMLLTECRRQSWFPQAVTRRLLFANIRIFRQMRDEPAKALVAEFMRDLGRGWYFFFWARRKLTNPPQKLAHWIFRKTTGQPKTKPKA